MTHENCANLYSDWGSIVHCSFKNVFTASVAHIVGSNLQTILGINHFKSNDMAKQAPLPYNFTCKRKEANSIRDHLFEITTESCSYIWFSMQTDPFHFLANRRTMIGDDPIHVKEYPVYFYFGSMYLYNTFNIHSEEHPSIHDISITRWKEEPETIRIMSKDKSRQIFIPVKWIQKQILVNTNNRPFIVFMLKYSVKMKRKIIKDGQSIYERICKIGENDFETIISKSSDILLSFDDIEHTYTFLNELMRETGDYCNKFTINFVTLKQIHINHDNQSFYFPTSASYKQHYALKMLYSMGYLFQDKYSKQIHDQFVTFNKELFNNMCYYLKEKLEENHCYKLKRIFNDFDVYMKEKHKEEEGESLEKKQPYSIGCVSLTPLRVLYQRMDSSKGNRALRMPQFGGEDMFLLVHIREEDNRILKDFDPSIKRRLKSKMLHGIQAMGKTYRLFGTSTSQLKEMSFWFAAIQDKSIEEAWKFLGDFSGIKNVANYVARIGLYFSTSQETQISFRYVEKISSGMQFVATTIDDIKTKDKKYCFTDGIGKMSWGIAGLVATKLKIKLESKDDIPSAYQVRIAGCKGMLAIDHESTLNDYYIKVRESMEKFKSNNWDLEICEYSRPLELKFNNQVIMLLSDLGNSGAVFESYQNASFNNWAEQNKDEQNRKLKYSLAKEDLLKNKIPLPLNEARNMFGIADETGTLEYGQVFIQYTNFDSTNENKYIVITGEVIVAKMPCLHPGDIRKFTAVDVPQLKSCIRDCIVFPIKGPRPHPNEMSGSDLDGDQYWVYWGKSLKIRQMDEPLSYEAPPKKLLPKITNEIVIDHIIESFGAGSQGIICDVHLAIADSHQDHTRSADCKYLAELFARAVDAPKTGEIIDLDKVYELRAKHCRGYPLFMKKYDQPIRDSNSILNKLFLRARRHLFMLREQGLQTSPQRPYTRSQAAAAKARAQRKIETNVQDKELQKWLLSLDIHRSEDNTSESLPVLVNSSVIKKPSRSTNNKGKEIDSKSLELPTEQPIAAPKKRIKKPTLKKEEEEVESEPVQIPSTKGKRASIDSKTSGSATAESAVIPKPSASIPSAIDNILNRNIVFNGMTTVSNRLKWNEKSNDSFIIDLDTKTSGENNAVDKIIQLMIDSAKASPSPANTKLTLVISWGELVLKIPQAMEDTKPKNIKELSQIIKENNDVEFSFREYDIKTITDEREPSRKSTAEYIIVCKSHSVSPNDILLIFDDKKKLKKIALISTWWICAVRGGEELTDSFYQIHCTSDEIDSKHESFSQYLKSIFKDSNSIDLLSGTSPRITIAIELLKSTIQIVSLRRLIRCEYANLSQNRFDTLTNLDYTFYHVTNISTEKTSSKIQTRETIEFHATQIQIAKKHEKDLKQLCTLAEDFFD